MSLRFKDFASKSRAWQGKFVFQPVFQRASRGPPHFPSRPTNRTISKSDPLHKLKLSRTNARFTPGRGGAHLSNPTPAKQNTKHQTPSPRKVPKSKHQKPSSREAPSS